MHPLSTYCCLKCTPQHSFEAALQRTSEPYLNKVLAFRFHPDGLLGNDPWLAVLKKVLQFGHNAGYKVLSNGQRAEQQRDRLEPPPQRGRGPTRAGRPLVLCISRGTPPGTHLPQYRPLLKDPGSWTRLLLAFDPPTGGRGCFAMNQWPGPGPT